MIDRTLKEIGVIFFTIIVAFGLSLLPLPMVISPFIPDWVLLIMVYWMIYFPQRIGFFVVWVCGLLIDVLTNSLLGEHALAGVVVAYFVLKFYRRIRLFSIGQQMISIGVLLGIYRAILFWIQGLIQQPLSNMYWLPILIGTLLWPLIAVVLNDSQQRDNDFRGTS
jgi:rod shape-determining protein MreD